MEIIIGIIFFIGIMLYTSFSWGFVGCKLYTWFILPVFTSLPIIDNYQFIGIILFISLFNIDSKVYEAGILDQKSTWLMVIISPWATLIISYIIKAILID